MTAVEENFKVNLNQNLWGLLVALGAVGVGERFDLQTLYWLGFVLSSVMLLSVGFTTFAYTRNYWRSKST